MAPSPSELLMFKTPHLQIRSYSSWVFVFFLIMVQTMELQANLLMLLLFCSVQCLVYVVPALRRNASEEGFCLRGKVLPIEVPRSSLTIYEDHLVGRVIMCTSWERKTRGRFTGQVTLRNWSCRGYPARCDRAKLVLSWLPCQV